MSINRKNIIKVEEYFTKEEMEDYFVAPLEKLKEFTEIASWWNLVSDVDAIEILATISEKEKGHPKDYTDEENSLGNKERKTTEIF